MVKNCRFCNNRAFFAGDNGFGHPGMTDSHLLVGMPGMEISGNYFYGGNFISGFSSTLGFEMCAGNICHIKPGQYLIQISTNDRDYTYYPTNPTAESVADAVAQYRAKEHDNHTVFIGIDSEVSAPTTD